MHVLIVNPVSGGGASLSARDSLLAYGRNLNIPMRAVMTQYPGHATQLAREAVSKNACAVWMLGGDGSLGDAAQGLVGQEIPLGIIPCGTGNDFARMLKIPAKPTDAFAYQYQRPKTPVDLWRINERFFLNVAGTGFDSEALIHARKFKRLGGGLFPYLLSVLTTILTHKDVHIDLTMNGRTRTLTALMATFASGRTFGGGIYAAPDAHPGDGFLDVGIVDPIPKWRMIFILPKFLKGTQTGEDYVSYERTDEIWISSDTPLLFETDGELWEAQSAHIRKVEGGLNILAGFGP